MRQVTRKGLMTMAAATGVIAAAGAPTAYAGSGASGSAANSPGVLSGNSVQAPVHAPVNVCGNTVDVVGALNPAAGNSCANHSGSPGSHGGHGGGGHHGGHGHSGGSGAHGSTSGSPGVGSGNHVQAPIDTPVNVCGNSVDVIGIANPSMGNDCASDGGYGTPPDDGYGTPPGPPDDRNVPPSPPATGHPPTTPGEHPPTPGHRTPEAGPPSAHSIPQPRTGGQLASTGSELPIGAAAALGVSAVLGGAVLYRRKRVPA
ncbi:chaplin family protein [Streptomyces sp. NPDC006458]|uniref:chaplin family protein n=1 Tax=Streptomyces sp. NPDC006458 TaxID=3154302 RepID=UPI0033B540CA